MVKETKFEIISAKLKKIYSFSFSNLFARYVSRRLEFDISLKTKPLEPGRKMESLDNK